MSAAVVGGIKTVLIRIKWIGTPKLSQTKKLFLAWFTRILRSNLLKFSLSPKSEKMESPYPDETDSSVLESDFRSPRREKSSGNVPRIQWWLIAKRCRLSVMKKTARSSMLYRGERQCGE